MSTSSCTSTAASGSREGNEHCLRWVRYSAVLVRTGLPFWAQHALLYRGGNHPICWIAARGLDRAEGGQAVRGITLRHARVAQSGEQRSQIAHRYTFGFANIYTTQQGYECRHLPCGLRRVP